MVTRSSVGAIAVVALVLTGGCLGILLDDGDDTGVEATPSGDGDGTPADGEANDGGDGESDGGDGNATPTPSTKEPVYGDDLADVDVRNNHIGALGDYRSFTYRETTRWVTAPDTGDAREETTTLTAEVDLVSRRVAIQHDTPSMFVEAYRSPGGETLAYLEDQNGDVTYPPPDPSIVDAEEYRDLRGAWMVDPGEFTHESTRDEGERQLDVYTASGTEAVTHWFYDEQFDVDPSAISALDAELVVDDTGVVRSVDVTADLTLDGTNHRAEFHVEYTGLGETDPGEPGWIDDARAARSDDAPSEGEPVEFQDQDGNLGVTATVTAPYREGTQVLVIESQNPAVYDRATNASRAAPVVKVDVPNGTQAGTVSFEYDESDVYQGDEFNLTVVRYDYDARQFVPVEATLNTASNTASAALDDEDGVYSLVHLPTYQRIQGNDDGDDSGNEDDDDNGENGDNDSGNDGKNGDSGEES